MKPVYSVFALTLVIAAPLCAQPPQTPAAPQTQSQVNPDQVICQKETVVGSRLATRRVCLTRQQWAERRLQDRQDTERSQLIVPCTGGKSSPC